MQRRIEGGGFPEPVGPDQQQACALKHALECSNFSGKNPAARHFASGLGVKDPRHQLLTKSGWGGRYPQLYFCLIECGLEPAVLGRLFSTISGAASVLMRPLPDEPLRHCALGGARHQSHLTQLSSRGLDVNIRCAISKA